MRLIARRASASDIYKDVETTHKNATAAGGEILTLSNNRLSPVLTIAATLKSQIDAIKEATEDALAKLSVLDRSADGQIGQVADDFWNAIGRPQSDPTYSLFFPEGIGMYTEGSNFDQPDRMDLLVDLLAVIPHPALTPAVMQGFHNKLAATAKTYREAATPLRAQVRKLEHFEHVYVVLSKHAQTQLVRFKAGLVSLGLSDARIKEIIPSHTDPRTGGGGTATGTGGGGGSTGKGGPAADGSGGPADPTG